MVLCSQHHFREGNGWRTALVLRWISENWRRQVTLSHCYITSTFNYCMPSSHVYLGNNMNVVSNFKIKKMLLNSPFYQWQQRHSFHMISVKVLVQRKEPITIIYTETHMHAYINIQRERNIKTFMEFFVQPFNR